MSLPYLTEYNTSQIVNEKLKEAGPLSVAIRFYTNNTTYNTDDLVVYGGELYRSLTNQNIGHNPMSDDVNWIRLQHAIAYKSTLPPATEKSASFVEINGQLYYKTNTSNSNGYQYKKVDSEGPGGGIVDALVDGKSVVNEDNIAVINPQVKEYRNDLAYAKNTLVAYQGFIFKSLIDDNFGNLPLDPTKWKDISKECYNIDEMIEATVDSPAILEYRGDLYYKVVSKSDKYISYSYKKIETGGGSGTTAFTKVDRDEIETYDFKSNTLYLLAEEKTYTAKTKYNITDEAHDNGWDINETGITNPNQHIAWRFSEIPSHWDTVRDLIIYNEDGLLSTARDKKDNLVCKYREDWEDSFYYSFAVYDKTLIEIPEYEQRFNGQYVVKTSSIISTSSREGFPVDIYELTDQQINDMFEAFLQGKQVYILDEIYDRRINIISAKGDNGIKTITLLYNEYIVNYIKAGTEVTHDVVDLKRQYIDLDTTSGELDIDVTTLSDNTVFRYLDNEEVMIHYMTKHQENMYGIDFRGDKYSVYISKLDNSYEVTENDDSSTYIIDTILTSLTTGDDIKFPVLGFTPIQGIIDAISKQNIVIRAGGRFYKVVYVRGYKWNDAEVVLEYYEDVIKDNMLITYKTNQEAVTTTLRPVHPITFTYHESQSEGQLPEEVHTLFMHNNNYQDAIFYYVQGTGPTKTSKLTMTYIQDDCIYYVNDEFWCEVNTETFTYTMGAKNNK